MDMTSRYLGLVVVPGQHIVRIEVEEFASQMGKREDGSVRSRYYEQELQEQQQQQQSQRQDIVA